MNVTHEREQQGGISVAIVDDHRLVVDGLTAHLKSRKLGIRVAIGATSWTEFLSHPEFPVDVAVLDLTLDDSVSIGVKLRALSAAGTHTVIISRHADSASISGAFRAGALAFIPKSDAADELVRAIRTAALGERYENRSLALIGADIAVDPRLGRQEERALMLYASGRSIREVASDMGTTEETVKSYIKRARRKYREVGVDLGTKILLRKHGIREGWLTPE